MSTAEVNQIITVIRITGLIVGFIVFLSARTKIPNGFIIGLCLSILVPLFIRG